MAAEKKSNGASARLNALEKQLHQATDWQEHQNILSQMLATVKQTANAGYVKKHGLPKDSHRRLVSEVNRWGLPAIFSTLYGVMEEGMKDPAKVDLMVMNLHYVADEKERARLEKIGNETSKQAVKEDEPWDDDLDVEDDSKKSGKK